MAVSTRRHFHYRASPLSRELLGTTQDLDLSLISDRPGLVEFPGSSNLLISIHVGASAGVDCRRGGERHVGTNVHGDVEIIPPKTPGSWELKSSDSALVIGLKLRLLRNIVEQLGASPDQLRVTNRFQIRDPQIEHIAWALKAEMERGNPSGRLFTDALATGLAASIVSSHSSLARPGRATKVLMPPRKLKNVLAYVEDHVARDLSLTELAQVAGLSTSHFKALFRKSVGVPPHQYLIRRRVERAAAQLRAGTAPIGQVALENGFCHQSHLALHTRRILGVTPQEVRDNG